MLRWERYRPLRIDNMDAVAELQINLKELKLELMDCVVMCELEQKTSLKLWPRLGPKEKGAAPEG